jgi:hypothetical protein
VFAKTVFEAALQRGITFREAFREPPSNKPRGSQRTISTILGAQFSPTRL